MSDQPERTLSDLFGSGSSLRIGMLAILAGAWGANAQADPLQLTGWNNDVVAEGNTLPLSSTTAGIAGWSYYEAGRTSNPSGTTQGLPSNGTIVSTLAGNTVFQLQPYTSNNAATIFGGNAPTVTLTLAVPLRLSQIQLLFTVQKAGGVTWNATVNFSDTTSTVFGTFNDADWTSSTGGDIAASGMGLITRDADGLPIYSGGLYLREERLSLAAPDQSKFVQSITFDVVGSDSTMNLAVFAVSGTAIPEPSSALLAGISVLGWLGSRRRRSGIIG